MVHINVYGNVPVSLLRFAIKQKFIGIHHKCQSYRDVSIDTVMAPSSEHLLVQQY